MKGLFKSKPHIATDVMRHATPEEIFYSNLRKSKQSHSAPHRRQPKRTAETTTARWLPNELLLEKHQLQKLENTTQTLLVI